MYCSILLQYCFLHNSFLKWLAHLIIPQFHSALLTSGSLLRFSSPKSTQSFESYYCKWFLEPDGWVCLLALSLLSSVTLEGKLDHWPWVSLPVRDRNSTCHIGLMKSKWNDPCKVFTSSHALVSTFISYSSVWNVFHLFEKKQICSEWEDMHPWFTQYSSLKMKQHR